MLMKKGPCGWLVWLAPDGALDGLVEHAPALHPRRSSPPRAPLLPQKMEPKTYFANERTLLAWLHMAVTIGSIAAALLGYSGATQSSTHPEDVRPWLGLARFAWLGGCGLGVGGMPVRTLRMRALLARPAGAKAPLCPVPTPEPRSTTHARPQQAPESVQLIAIILLPVGIIMCAYSLMVYLWRTDQIASKSLSYIDDRRWGDWCGGRVAAAMREGVPRLCFGGRLPTRPSPPSSAAGAPARWHCWWWRRSAPSCLWASSS